MYKFKLFGYDWLNVLLGFLQNGLSKVFTINKIYQKIIIYDEEKRIPEIYYSAGRIFTLCMDFEPIILE